jgi:hypothetical protein
MRGFSYQCRCCSSNSALTQVFDRPLRRREFFESVIGDNLDLGRPHQVQLLFPRKITRATPGRLTTRVITDGVNPNLHIAYKRCDIKQYFKEERALRTDVIAQCAEIAPQGPDHPPGPAEALRADTVRPPRRTFSYQGPRASHPARTPGAGPEF